jgi:lysophospholipase L1-like esterase
MSKRIALAVVCLALVSCSGTEQADERVESAAATLPNVTVWIAGDSTVANGSTPCPVGWGAELASFFTSQVNVVNSAVGGRSVRTWLYSVTSTMDSTGECVLDKDSSGRPILQARWQAMLDGMKAGDYLLVQFGINDAAATCDRHVGLEAFKASYGMMAQAAQQRGAHPIFLTPLSAISCSGSTARGTRGNYVTAAIQAGAQYGVPVIDLHALSVAYYNSLRLCPLPGGASDVSSSTGGAVGAFFCNDHTHLERTGANQIAGLIAKALKDKGIGLSAYLLGATPTTYTLTIATGGTGAGGTSPAVGAHAYAAGTVVSVTATPASGSTFTGWSGAATGAANPVSITVSSDQTLTASFASGTTGSTPCANPITMSGGQSGNLDTTGAACLRTSATISGWGCSNFDGRTVQVNGVATTCGRTPLPARWSDGYNYFAVSAGTYPWASLYYW